MLLPVLKAIAKSEAATAGSVLAATLKNHASEALQLQYIRVKGRKQIRMFLEENWKQIYIQVTLDTVMSETWQPVLKKLTKTYPDMPWVEKSQEDGLPLHSILVSAFACSVTNATHLAFTHHTPSAMCQCRLCLELKVWGRVFTWIGRMPST